MKRKKWSELADACKVTRGKDFKLEDHDPDDTHGLSDGDKHAARARIEELVAEMSELQERLYAQDEWGALLIIQGMDCSGKDGAVKHVMSGLNPQGVRVHSFKAPSDEEKSHDFMWRCWTRLPERGQLTIFNRSYYEEVLVVRVHPEYLAGQKLPPSLVSKSIWKDRCEDIAGFERYLGRSGFMVRKIFLNISAKEQKKRLLDRLDEPDAHWKFNPGDVAERQHWDEYMEAYEDTIRRTATPESPWYVVPANQKWFARLVVAQIVADTLRDIDPQYPKVDRKTGRDLAASRELLENE